MIDRLINKIKRLEAPIVVGLDPTPDVVPDAMFSGAAKRFGETPDAGAFALLEFNCEIIDAIENVVPAVKPNIAFYERYGLYGIRAYIKSIEYAKSRGLMVIGDIKRGDIGSTAAAYAGHLDQLSVFGHMFDVWNEDAVTLSPYLGEDSITPFLDVLKKHDKGVFILVKTSNTGSADIQDLLIDTKGRYKNQEKDNDDYNVVVNSNSNSNINGSGISGGGSNGSSSIPLYEHVADLVSKWGEADGLVGEYGYSKVGAVVGATHPETGAKLRELMPHTFFLVPGYGAQGAGAKDVKRFFDAEGSGAIVNSSRGIIGAWKAEGKDAGSIGECAYAAAIKMRDELGAVL